MSPARTPAARSCDRIRRRSLVVGGRRPGRLRSWPRCVGPVAFFPAYLVAYLFWVGISLGCLALLMLHHLVGGAWGFPIRRPLEAAAMTHPADGAPVRADRCSGLPRPLPLGRPGASPADDGAPAQGRLPERRRSS